MNTNAKTVGKLQKYSLSKSPNVSMYPVHSVKAKTLRRYSQLFPQCLEEASKERKLHAAERLNVVTLLPAQTVEYVEKINERKKPWNPRQTSS